MSSDSQVAVGWIVSSPLFCGTIWAACRPAQVLDFLGNSRSYLHVSLQRILVNILGPLSSSHTIVNSVLCRSYWQHQTLWSSEFQWLKKKSWLKFWVAMGMLDCDCGWFGVPGARVCSTIWTPARPTGETSDTRGVTRRVMDTPAFSPHNYYQIDDAPKATWRPMDISRKNTQACRLMDVPRPSLQLIASIKV